MVGILSGPFLASVTSLFVALSSVGPMPDGTVRKTSLGLPLESIHQLLLFFK
jgi:hypothetical protein